MPKPKRPPETTTQTCVSPQHLRTLLEKNCSTEPICSLKPWPAALASARKRQNLKALNDQPLSGFSALSYIIPENRISQMRRIGGPSVFSSSRAAFSICWSGGGSSQFLYTNHLAPSGSGCHRRRIHRVPCDTRCPQRKSHRVSCGSGARHCGGCWGRGARRHKIHPAPSWHGLRLRMTHRGPSCRGR